MTAVEKVTISLPAELMTRIEGRRRETGGSRSEVIADLLWRGWRELDDERREERYRAAYRAQPETAHELAWADLAADELVASNQSDMKPAGTPEPNGHAPG